MHLSEDIFCSPVQSCVPTILRIGYLREETPENVERKAAKAAVFNFDHYDFEEVSRG